MVRNLRNFLLHKFNLFVLAEFCGIPHSILIEKVFEVLTEESCTKYFGNCYLQILQRFVLKPKNNLTAIKLEQWQSKKLNF